MVIERARLGARHVVRVGDAPGVGELDADDEIVGAAETPRVGRHEVLTQAGDVGEGLVEHDELAGASAPLRADGDRLGAEDQLGAAQAPALPAPPGEFGGPAVSGTVPALHGQDREAVADGAAVELERPGERRRRP